MQTNILFEPLQLPCGTIIKNRFFKSAMSEALGTNDNKPSLLLPKLYQKWAEGGAGIIMTGNIMIDHTALGEPNNVVIENEESVDLLQKWADAGKQNGAHHWVQLNHPGKQSPKFLSKEPVAPSRIPLSGPVAKYFAPPRELTEDEIIDTIKRFGHTASIVKKAGFTGVQIHAAHGYLINQFLSPYHNQRSDQWGGSLENRMRFLLEVYSEIRHHVGDSFPIAIKLNSADFQRGGFTEEESIQVIQTLVKMKIDLIEISGGNYEKPMMMGKNVKESTQKREAYFLEFARKARAFAPQTPLVVTGGFRSVHAMEEACTSGAIDMLGIARPFVLTPDLPNQIRRGTYQTQNLPAIKTGIKPIDKASLLENFWYEYQMARIGNGKTPHHHFNRLSFLLHILLTQGTNLFQVRRSKR
ncbi:NADH:flavin oxidoreductase/NADH oxidase family protein [Hazenella sp. IB182357]|uniref:NADH:flavin oxidoreductase/NADH oxidase family protein n=1 Tax=Polycladospora coralii TaxID=2771432 RepID=A0A926RZ07_9BACL|nr:NADH:flavin oxidoreductase/NADH oxidase family protein [Polycladospora coralii]MBD1374011.1 NADH:flavin oxidoreductase/NADH oxidase family protein [Polycladospora coralii]